MKPFYLIFVFRLLLTIVYADEKEEAKACQKLNEECTSTESCCLGKCVNGHCNDGLFKNNKDRGNNPDRDLMIAAELSTKTNIDVSEHPNIKLLPTAEECGESASTKPHSRRKRIVGGSSYELGKYPWAVSIHINNITSGESEFQCGASLINKRYILTAAHCSTRFPSGKMLKWVTLGNVDRRYKLDCENQTRDKPCEDKKYLDLEIEETIVHEGYSESNVRHDIALIRLKEEVNYTDFIRPICLPRNEKMFKSWPDALLTVVGWGTQMTPFEPGVPHISVVAQEVEMNLVHRSNCDRFLTHMIGKLKRSQFCAGGYPGKGDCSGDSGGPLFKRLLVDAETEGIPGMERYFLFGLVSTGPTSMCAREGMPSVFTNVLYYMPWILDNIVPKEKPFVDKPAKETFKPLEEFATGMTPPVDVRNHQNIYFLPSFPNCGIAPGSATSPTNQHFKSGAYSRVKRIVGGVTQATASLPWLAQVYVRHAGTTDTTLRCGGVLISPRYVLLAAHCVSDIRGPFVLDGVVVGSTNRKQLRECLDDGECVDFKVSLIEDVVVHESFSKYSREYDIALIRLIKPVMYSKFIQPICLPLHENIVTKAWPNPNKDIKYIAAGWGRVTPESTENLMSNILVAATLTLESKKTCETSLIRKTGKMDKKRICGGGTPTGKGECVGDTGGPMLRYVNQTDQEGNAFIRAYAFGILSIVECGNPGVPAIYQNVLYYMPWILDNMEE